MWFGRDILKGVGIYLTIFLWKFKSPRHLGFLEVLVTLHMFISQNVTNSTH